MQIYMYMQARYMCNMSLLFLKMNYLQVPHKIDRKNLSLFYAGFLGVKETTDNCHNNIRKKSLHHTGVSAAISRV